MAAERLGTYNYFIKSIRAVILEELLAESASTSGDGLQQITSAMS